MKKTKCRGNVKPLFKISKHLFKNPHYLSTEKGIIANQNTTDEFITLHVRTQQGWVCIDCNKPDCPD